MFRTEKQKSFKKKILFFFILISILPLLIVSFSNLYLVIKTRQQNITELQSLVIDNVDDKIVKFLNEKSKGLNLVVSAPVDSLYDLPLAPMQSFLSSSYFSTYPKTLNFIDKNGFILAKVNEDRSAYFLNDYLSLYPNDVFFEGQNSDRSVKYSNSQKISKIEADVSQSEDYLTAISGKNYVGPLEFVDDRTFIRLAGPIINQYGNIIGVVAAEIEPKEIQEIIRQAKTGDSGYVYLLEDNGRAIASGNKELVDVNGSLFSVPLINKIIKEGKMGNVYPSHFTTYRNSNDQDVIFLGRKMNSTDWYIISEWPVTDAFGVIGHILLLSLYIVLITLLITVILGLFLTGQITNPIYKLIRGVKKISEGDLEHKIELKTNDDFELLGDKFNEMIKILKENQRLRDEFVFVAAHELRTPVTAVKGYISMILEGTFGEAPPKISENLQIINKANERLVQLVQDLLEVARSEAGKMKVDMKEVNIVENVRSVIVEIDSLAKEKNIIIKYESDKENIPVMGDAYKLKEVLVNIIGNAVKYTLKSSEINIYHKQEGDYLITYVKDQGIGMSKEAQKELFSKFYRIQTDETKNIEGTGLGLFICKEIMERMGGSIWVESEEGKGSIFGFKLKILK